MGDLKYSTEVAFLAYVLAGNDMNSAAEWLMQLSEDDNWVALVAREGGDINQAALGKLSQQYQNLHVTTMAGHLKMSIGHVLLDVLCGAKGIDVTGVEERLDKAWLLEFDGKSLDELDPS